MAARKKSVAKKTTAKTPETSLRHLWLAGLGLVAIARRETRNAANDAVARIDALKQQAARLAGEAQDNVRGGIASVREQGEARVGQISNAFSAEVEARLAPVLAKLGLKPKPAARKRKTTKKAAKAVRRTPARGKTAAKRVANKRR